MADVFISYSHKDKAVADAACFALEQNGIKCWYAPRDIVPGKEWAASIVEGIGAARVFVLIFSDFSNASGQVLREVSKAVDEQLTILPLKISDTKPSGGMEYYLSSIHWLDAIDGELSEHINTLVMRVAAVLDKPAEDIKSIDTAGIKPAKAKRSIRILAACMAAAFVLIGGGLWFVLSRGGAKDTGGSSGGSSVSVVKPSNEGAVITDPENSYTQGNLQCNIVHGGLAASYGGWVYYQSNDGQKLYKMNQNGKNASKVTDTTAQCISVYDGWIYFTTCDAQIAIVRIKTDGTGEQVIYDGHSEVPRIIDGQLYFKNGRDGLTLYRMELDGSGLTKLNDIRKTYSLTIGNGYMYYRNTEDNNCLYRCKLDGSQSTKMSDETVDDMAICGSQLVYTISPAGKMSSVHVLDLEELTDSMLNTDYFYYIAVSDYGIFAYSGVNSTHLYKQPLNGGATMELCDDMVRNISVVDGWVYYMNKTDEKNYRISADGEGRMLLP